MAHFLEEIDLHSVKFVLCFSLVKSLLRFYSNNDILERMSLSKVHDTSHFIIDKFGFEADFLSWQKSLASFAADTCRQYFVIITTTASTRCLVEIAN